MSFFTKALACVLSIPFLSLALPVFAAEDEMMEEVIVTGSYIKREKIDFASPVETITVDELNSSGYTQLGHYVRDLTYTANIDTVANVLATRGGIQDSNRTSFNLRGLGAASTLTLIDGRRTLGTTSISDLLPDIALRSVEVVLDGGAATYGTDAVAGVVNLVPLEQFDGAQFRTFYTSDSGNDTYQYKVSALFGKSTDSVDLVFALEGSARPDPLRNFERPQYLRADNDTSISGSLPNWHFSTGMPSDASIFTRRVDPDCGQFNGDNTDDGLPGAYPSGAPLTFGLPFAIYCSTEYGRWHDTARAYDALNAYASITSHLTSTVDLKFQYHRSWNATKFNTSGTTAERGSNVTFIIPGGPTPLGRDGTARLPHPNNPTSFNLMPRDWRPFSINGTTPSHIDDIGSQTPTYTYDVANYSLGVEFDEFMGTGWGGEAWYSYQYYNNNIEGHGLSRERLGLALEGLGGPTGDQWLNPFGSRDPRSPNFCDAPVGQTGPGGCIGTNNTQELVDWLFVQGDYDALHYDRHIFEGFLTGDLFSLPGGTAQMAIGAQYRWTEYTNNASILQAQGDDYNSSILNGPDPGVQSDAGVYAIFGEWVVPFTETLEATLAVRHENFKDFGFDSTVPKISLLWSPTNWAAIRASWGEGFLAPTLAEFTVLEVPSCAEQFGGDDPFTGAPLAGAQSCGNGNTAIRPENSEIFNIGFSVQPIEGLDVSLDYQEVEYTDQIRQLSLIDMVEQDFNNFLQQNNLTEDAYNNLDAAAQQAALLAWIAATPDNFVERNATTGSIQKVTRVPVNVDQVNVSVFDLRVNYGFNLGDMGYVNTNWSTTYYTEYEYVDLTGIRTDALGKRNDDTDIAPPLPEFKHQGRVAWTIGDHLVALTAKGFSAVDFDGSVGPTFFGTILPAPDEVEGQWKFDVRYGYSFHDLFGMPGTLDFAIGANNAFDEEAQPLPVQGGLESRLHDPFGRMWYLELNYLPGE